MRNEMRQSLALCLHNLSFQADGFTFRYCTLMVLSFQTDRSRQGLHCLPFCLHLLDTLLYHKTTLFRIFTAKFSRVRIFFIFTVFFDSLCCFTLSFCSILDFSLLKILSFSIKQTTQALIKCCVLLCLIYICTV